MKVRTKSIITFIIASFMVLSMMLGLFSVTLFADETGAAAGSVVLARYAFFKPNDESKQVTPVPGGVYDIEIGVHEVGYADGDFENLRAFISGGDFTQDTTRIYTSSFPFSGANSAQRIFLEDVKYTGEGDKCTIRILYDVIDDEDNITPVDTTVSFSLSGGTSGSSKTGAPRIIIQKYDFGSTSVTAGSTFPLVLTIKNTSETTNIENLVMTLDPQALQLQNSSDVAFSLANSSNSFFINKLGAGKTHTETIDIAVLASANPASYRIDVNFSGDYIKNSEVVTMNASESIAIPVFQPDRFSVSPLDDLPAEIMAGEETYISVSFINKGKSQISNLSAKIVANNTNGTQEQYIGNVESGTEDSVEFAVIGEPGTMSGQIIFTYEDANLIEKEIPIPFSIQVVDSGMGFPGKEPGVFPGEEMPPDMMEPEQPSSPLKTIGIIAGAVIIVIIIVVIVLKKRKKAKLLAEEAEDEYN